MRPLNTNLIVL